MNNDSLLDDSLVKGFVYVGIGALFAKAIADLFSALRKVFKDNK